MKYFKILPAAAGVIALTATIVFARDMRDNEEAYSLRIKVSASTLPAHNDDTATASLPHLAGDRKQEPLYLVEVARENVKSMITIDASTGRILDNREIPV